MNQIVVPALVIAGIYVGGCAVVAAAFTVGVALTHTRPKRKRKK